MIYLLDQFPSEWFSQYGSLALMGLLALGIVGLPIPDETLLTLAGAGIAQGKLLALQTVLAAYTGSILGITLSYVLGRTTGYFLLHRYGPWVGLTEKKIKTVHDWFERCGKWTLVLGYFIPGVRHFTGYVAGATQLPFSIFALFAYSGAVLWSSIFLSLGYGLGVHTEKWIAWLEAMAGQLFVIVTAVLILAYFLWRGRCFFKNKKTNPGN